MRAKDVRKGSIIIYQNVPHKVTEFIHRTPGNLRAFVQVKLRNILNGVLTETRFSSTEDLTEADVFNYKAQFLYKDDLGYNFMNQDNYEQTTISEEMIGDNSAYLVDGLVVDIMTYDERPIGVQLPKTVELTIVDCPPEIKGATATNSPKQALTNTGLTVGVPPFLSIGDKIVVNTEDGSYLSRAE